MCGEYQSLGGAQPLAVQDAGTVEPEDVEALIDGSFSVMRYLKMLPGQPTPVEHPVWITKIDNLASDYSGIFYPLVKPGTYVSQGMKVSYVTDHVGKMLLEARAPGAAVVLYIRAAPSLMKGDTRISVGQIGPKPQRRLRELAASITCPSNTFNCSSIPALPAAK